MCIRDSVRRLLEVIKFEEIVIGFGFIRDTTMLNSCSMQRKQPSQQHNKEFLFSYSPPPLALNSNTVHLQSKLSFYFVTSCKGFVHQRSSHTVPMIQLNDRFSSGMHIIVTP